MEGFALLLLFMALGARRRGATPGGFKPGTVTPGEPDFGEPKLVGPLLAPRPAGDPPPFGADCHNVVGGPWYDAEFWDRIEKPKEVFASLNYPVPAVRPTMNQLGADGKLGGGDDQPNQSVRMFQNDYNIASNAGLLPAAGGLDVDGFVGPCTLNGLRYVLDVFGSGPQFRQAVSQVS